MNFGRSVIIAHLWRPEVARRENLLRNFLRFVWKTTPYSIIFKVLFWKFLSPHQSTLLSSNFVKFADKKSAKSCVIYQTKKTKFRLPLQLSLLRGSFPKSARANPQQCTHSVPYISSWSVFFRRSYIAERVNTAKLPRSVNPIFGGSLASSRIINDWFIEIGENYLWL